MLQIWGNLRKGREDKGALRDKGVGYPQVRRIQNQVAVEKYVHVHCPGPVAHRGHAPQLPLHVLGKGQQLMGGQGVRKPHAMFRKDGCSA